MIIKQWRDLHGIEMSLRLHAVLDKMNMRDMSALSGKVKGIGKETRKELDALLAKYPAPSCSARETVFQLLTKLEELQGLCWRALAELEDDKPEA